MGTTAHGSVIDWLREPEHWVRVAWWVLAYAVVGQLASHALVVVLKPPEASWVFHLLLALSWQAVQFTALGIIVTTDIRKHQHEDS